MNLILCGLPASGKTTVGKIIATHLNWIHVDLDQLIIENYSNPTVSTCRQICLNEGETYFRFLENQQIAKLMPLKNSIISVGGGSLSHFDNDKCLKKIGCLVYLKADISILWNRVKERGGLSFITSSNPQKEFTQIMQHRQIKLDLIADLTVEIKDLNCEEIALVTLSKWREKYGQ